MLTPSSNTALEPLTTALLAPLVEEVSAHFARFRVTRIAIGGASDDQFRSEPILAAAELLSDARSQVVAWNGTSASWLGFDTDAALCAAIEARTGARATSAIVSLNALLRRFDVGRLGLVTPYTADVQARIAANYAAVGVEVASEVHAGLSENFAFAEIAERDVAQMIRDAAAPGVDAVAIVCTNMRGALVAPALERELGVPVLDSVSVTLWGSLLAAGVDPTPLSAFGRLFGMGPWR